MSNVLMQDLTPERFFIFLSGIQMILIFSSTCTLSSATGPSVYDVSSHYGSFEWDDTLGKVDSWRNILSNKVSALYRVEAKDVVDLWNLAKLKCFNWSEIVREASSKEAGIDPLVIYDLLKSFPKEELSSIKWIEPEPDKQWFGGQVLH